MRGYGQYCPIARGTEVLATRRTPIIVRNLLLGCRTFSELHHEHFDAGIVLWGLLKTLEDEPLPRPRVVVRFDVRAGRRRERYWLVVERGGGEVCAKPPGYPEDLVVSTTDEWLTKWHVGRISLGDAMHAGLMTVDGPRTLVRTLARWGGRGAHEGFRRAVKGSAA